VTKKKVPQHWTPGDPHRRECGHDSRRLHDCGRGFRGRDLHGCGRGDHGSGRDLNKSERDIVLTSHANFGAKNNTKSTFL